MPVYASTFGSSLQVVKTILRYPAGTLDVGMTLRPNPSFHMVLEGFCDADWTSDPDDRRFTPSFCIYLMSNLVSWNSMKLDTISRSSTEALHNGC